MSSQLSGINYFSKKPSDYRSAEDKWFNSLKIFNISPESLQVKYQNQTGQASLEFGTFSLQNGMWLNPMAIDANISETNPAPNNSGNPQFPQGNLQNPENDESKSLKRRPKNETKNIPKNFGKAIISFIIKNKNFFIEKLKYEAFEFERMIVELKKVKKIINTIADLRNLWLNNKYAKQIRMMSNYFLRRHGTSYVFNSRITSRDIHLKHKNRLIEAIKAPQKFIHIKEY